MKNIGVKEVEMVGVYHDTYPTVGKGPMVMARGRLEGKVRTGK